MFFFVFSRWQHRVTCSVVMSSTSAQQTHTIGWAPSQMALPQFNMATGPNTGWNNELTNLVLSSCVG